jgi:hypothetical protein
MHTSLFANSRTCRLCTRVSSSLSHDSTSASCVVCRVSCVVCRVSCVVWYRTGWRQSRANVQRGRQRRLGHRCPQPARHAPAPLPAAPARSTQPTQPTHLCEQVAARRCWSRGRPPARDTQARAEPRTQSARGMCAPTPSAAGTRLACAVTPQHSLQWRAAPAGTRTAPPPLTSICLLCGPSP